MKGLRRTLEDLSQGRTSAIAGVQDALARAERSKQRLNAFSVLARNTATAAAMDSDRRYAEGRPRPLEGLPIAVKDLFDTQGIETRYGSPAYLNHVPTADADVVQALTAQGAIVIGKTTTHEFAWGVTTASEVFGDTLNPLDSSRIPGGSSGGAAAAIVDGAVAAGLGTDTGGSVRIPAALCGAVGFKPSAGRWSTRGIFPLAPSLDHPGLLGARVDDVTVLAQALGIGEPETGRVGEIRLGIVRELAPVPSSEAVAVAFDGAVERLGHAFACTRPDTTALFEGVFAAFAGIVLAEGGMTHFARHDPDWIASHYGAETAERIVRAQAVGLGDYARWQQTRRRFALQLAHLMTRVDCLVLPTTPCTAPRIGEDTLQIGGWRGTVREALMAYTAPFNVAGFPAIAIPIAAGEGSLPASLQIVARPGQDGALLALARRMEGILAAAPAALSRSR